MENDGVKARVCGDSWDGEGAVTVCARGLLQREVDSPTGKIARADRAQKSPQTVFFVGTVSFHR